MTLALSSKTEALVCRDSFEKLFDGANVSFCNINGKYYVSIRDLIMVVSEKNPNRAAETWSRDIKENKKKELAEFLETYQFPGILYIFEVTAIREHAN